MVKVTGIVSIFLLATLFCGKPTQMNAKTVEISKNNFPEKVLRTKIKKYDKNKNGYLENSERKKITKLSITKKKDINIKGILYCKEIKQLSLSTKGIVKNLEEVSKLKKMKKYTLGSANKKFNISNNKDLENLILYEMTNLKKIKIQGMKNLKKLSVRYCKKAKQVVIINNRDLLNLRVDENTGIREVEIKNNKSLKKVMFENNKDLNKIKIVQVKNLEILEIYGQKKELKKLTYEKMEKLVDFTLCNTALSDVDLDKIPNIKFLYYAGNNFSVLDFTKVPKLNELWIDDTKIKQLDVTMLLELKKLQCTNCDLNNLIVNPQNKITRLNVNNNGLSGVWDLNMFPNLGYFDCDNNKIEKIIVNNHTKIFSISCDNNNLQELNANDTDLYYLSCTQNPNVALYLPGKPAGDMWYTYDQTAKVTYQYE